MSENNTNGFGLTTWDEKNQTTKPQRNEEQVRIPFMKLQKGNNILRVITAPAKYWQVRFADGKSKYGTRVRCAFPSVDRDECPTVQAGLRPKKRYNVGVIHRHPDEGASIKILDLSVLTYEQLQAFASDPEVGTPDRYDINIRFNPDASSPQGFYQVIPRGIAPLSESDQALINQVGMDVIEDNLIRLCTPHSVERVREKLISLGWDGESKVVNMTSNKNSGPELKEVSEDDYSFDDAEGE